MSGAVDKVTGVYSERHIWRKLTFEYGVKEYGIWSLTHLSYSLFTENYNL